MSLYFFYIFWITLPGGTGESVKARVAEHFVFFNSYTRMVNLNIPPKYLALYARCIDDSLPTFEPEEWIEAGRIYPVKCFTEPLNVSEGMAVTILHHDGHEIHPSPSHWSFASHRFELFSIYLN